MNQAELRKGLRYAERAIRFPIGALCAYEAVAIFTGRTPSVTQFSHGNRWLAAVAAGLVAWHLVTYIEEEQQPCT